MPRKKGFEGMIPLTPKERRDMHERFRRYNDPAAVSKRREQTRRGLVRAVSTAKSRLRKAIKGLVPACRVCQGTKIKVCETGKPIFIYCDTQGCGETYFNSSIQSSLTTVLNELHKKEDDLRTFDNRGIICSGGPGFSPFDPRFGSGPTVTGQRITSAAAA